MKQNDKYLVEGLDILNREFGQPLPTLEDTMKAHKLKKEGGPGSGKSKDGSAKDIEKKSMKAADDANAKMDADEKEMEKQAKAQAMADMGMDDDDMFESITEGPGDIKFAKKALSRIVKTEQKFRKQMYDLEQVFLKDPNPTNRKLATEIKKSYKDNTTKFMRDSVLMVKRMK